MSAQNNPFYGIAAREGRDEASPDIPYTELTYSQFVNTLLKKQSPDFMKLHCALGCAGEAGELADAIKKEIIYEKPLDAKNVIEECGDLLFYLQATMIQYGFSWEDVIIENYNKLSKRYKDLVYSDKAAHERADKQNG